MSDRQTLFRSEAIAFQRRGQLGEVVLLQPVPAKLLFWSLVAVFALIVGYLVLAQYARKETVTGYLAPTAGVAKIFLRGPAPSPRARPRKRRSRKAGRC